MSLTIAASVADPMLALGASPVAADSGDAAATTPDFAALLGLTRAPVVDAAAPVAVALAAAPETVPAAADAVDPGEMMLAGGLTLHVTAPPPAATPLPIGTSLPPQPVDIVSKTAPELVPPRTDPGDGVTQPPDSDGASDAAPDAGVATLVAPPPLPPLAPTIAQLPAAEARAVPAMVAASMSVAVLPGGATTASAPAVQSASTAPAPVVQNVPVVPQPAADVAMTLPAVASAVAAPAIDAVLTQVASQAPTPAAPSVPPPAAAIDTPAPISSTVTPPAAPMLARAAAPATAPATAPAIAARALPVSLAAPRVRSPAQREPSPSPASSLVAAAPDRAVAPFSLAAPPSAPTERPAASPAHAAAEATFTRAAEVATQSLGPVSVGIGATGDRDALRVHFAVDAARTASAITDARAELDRALNTTGMRLDTLTVQVRGAAEAPRADTAPQGDARNASSSAQGDAASSRGGDTRTPDRRPAQPQFIPPRTASRLTRDRFA